MTYPGRSLVQQVARTGCQPLVLHGVGAAGGAYLTAEGVQNRGGVAPSTQPLGGEGGWRRWVEREG